MLVRGGKFRVLSHLLREVPFIEASVASSGFGRGTPSSHLLREVPFIEAEPTDESAHPLGIQVAPPSGGALH
ncbi:hypothetical protein SAMN05444695_10615 [Rhodococcus triatomae]|uniref:Uncharacterized protein n=1 Tax=Rhodococcus triatomae TaxID=300028 RepID=A0A1G8IZ85_9NOCA|nr:hypothetical protein SAMN05444695_10615 [Rhodococcus triatomae]